MHMTFRAGFYVWSTAAPWIIGVPYRLDWQLHMVWDVTAPQHDGEAWHSQVVQNPTMPFPVPTAYQPVLPANQAQIETTEPGTMVYLHHRASP